MASKLVVIAGLVLVPIGCFTGADAKGLPCDADLDCGVDDKCIDGFCGGPPATVTTIDPTTTTSSSSSSGPDPTTGDPLCDNPDPVCEPMVKGMSDADCDFDCTLPFCGDGLENQDAPDGDPNTPDGNEQCDEGDGMTPEHAANCDADCTTPACGDDVYNQLAEDCDDGNTEDFDGCTDDCQVPALYERFDAMVWTSVPYDLSSYAGDPEWGDFDGVDTTGWTWNGSAWQSGEIPNRPGDPQVLQENYAATTRLVSDAFDIPAVPPGFQLQLRFQHTMSVESDGCAQDPDRNGDGGLVRLVESDDTESVLAPEGGYMELGTVCMLQGTPPDEPNPLRLENGVAFTGEQSGPVVIDLTTHAGKTNVRIVFEFGTDCIHCLQQEFSPSLWTIDDVIVAAFPM